MIEEIGMQKVKASQYNYILHNSNNELLIYNSLNYKFIKILSDEVDKIEPYLVTKEVVKSEGIINSLASRGIFVPEDCEELALVNNVYLDCINNEGTLAILITVTEDCNFRCPYCFEEHKQNRMSQEVMDNIVKFVQHNLVKYRGLYVYWFGGEPLLEIEIIDKLSHRLMKICDFYKKTYLASISTNGYYLTLDNLKRLVDCNVVGIQVTIDGTSYTHDKYRIDKDGKGTFDVIMNNLFDIRDHMNYGVYEIDIRTNYTEEIYEHLDEFVDFLEKNFAGNSRFRIFPRTAVDLGGSSINNVREHLIKEQQKMENNIFLKLSLRGVHLNYDALIRQLAPGSSVCYACQRNHYGIAVNGGVFKCNDLFQSHPEYNIGYLKNGKMIIDKYEEAKWIKNWNDIDDDCKRCVLFPVCLGGGCALMTYRQKYMGDKKKKNCMYEKKSIDNILRLLDFVNAFEIIE